MLADQLYVRPLGRSNFAQSPQKGTRTELIQFIAKRFVHRDSLPVRVIIYHRDRGGFPDRAGCQPAVSSSLRETVVFRCPENVSSGTAAGRLVACAPRTRKSY